MKKITLLLAVLLLAGCCGFLFQSAPKEVLSLVPKTANTVIIIRPSAILNDSDISSSFSSPDQMSSKLGSLKQTSGLNMSQIDQIVLFLKIDSIQGEVTYAGFIARGVIDNNSVIQSMEVDDYVTQTNYGDQVMYEITSKNDPTNKTYACFLDSSTLVGGTKEAVQDTIDVNSGKLDNVKANPNFNETYNALDNSSLAIMLMDLTPLKGGISQSVGNDTSSQSLSHLDYLGITFAKQEKNVNITILLTAEDSATASDLSDQTTKSLTGIEGMVKAGSPIDTIAREVNVNSNGKIVKITLSSNIDDLKSLANTLQSMFASRASSS